MPVITEISINHSNWTEFGPDGYIRSHGVHVQYVPGDRESCDIIRIGRTWHRSGDFVVVKPDYIKHRAGWYLRRETRR